MNKILSLSGRHIPFQVALPWLFLAMLAPFWLNYLSGLLGVLFHATSGALEPKNTAAAKVIGNDFTVFWSVGHLATTAHYMDIYNQAYFLSWQHTHLSQRIATYLQYFYLPPNILFTLITIPFSVFTGFLIWTSFLTLCGILVLARNSVPLPVIGFAALNTAFIFNMEAGQFGFLTGSLFISGLLAINRPTIEAGSLFGLLVIKPQAGLLAPIALLARGRYTAFSTGAIVVSILCIAITGVSGWAIWPAYFDTGMVTAHQMLVAAFPTHYEENGVSVFWMLRSLGATVDEAGICQIITAVGAALWCWIAWRRVETDRVALIALTTALTLLVTPYGYTTDMCGFTLMASWIAWERRRLEIADVLILMWPALCQTVSITTHIEMTPLILLLGALRAWKRLAGIGTPAPACYPAVI